MGPLNKSTQIFLLLPFYYLYQTIWLVTLSVVYTGLHEEQSQIWKNFKQVINPISVIGYSIVLYPISIASLTVLISISILLSKYKLSAIKTFLISILLVLLYNMFYLMIYSLVRSPFKELFNWISGNWNENTKTGLYGYGVGSLVFILLCIPVIRMLYSYKLNTHPNN